MPRSFFVLALTGLLAGSALGGWTPQQAAPLPAELSQPTTTDLAALRAKYVGKQVWLYGGGPLTCVTSNYSHLTLLGPPWTPVRIENVELAQKPIMVRISKTNVFAPRPVAHALLLTLRVGETFKTVSSSRGNAPTESPQLVTGSGCETVIQPFVDENHLRRLLSLTPPPAEIQSLWNNKTPSNIGLTHWQMLWLRGAPDSPPLASVAAVLQAGVWVTPGPAGYGDWITTFQNGRVVSESAPRQAP